MGNRRNPNWWGHQSVEIGRGIWWGIAFPFRLHIFDSELKKSQKHDTLPAKGLLLQALNEKPKKFPFFISFLKRFWVQKSIGWRQRKSHPKPFWTKIRKPILWLFRSFQPRRNRKIFLNSRNAARTKQKQHRFWFPAEKRSRTLSISFIPRFSFCWKCLYLSWLVSGKKPR